jgi:hypothetical protein
VQGFFWKLPLLRRLTPMWRGGLQCLFLVTFMAVGFGVAFVIDRPSTNEANTVATVGAAFLVAYGVETTWVTRETNQRSGPYQTWLGLITGLALCGLGGIVISVWLAGGSGTSVIRELGFAWSFGSIFTLGAMVAVTPLFTYEWRRQLMTEFDDE